METADLARDGGRLRAAFFSVLAGLSLLEFLSDPGLISGWADLPHGLWLPVGCQRLFAGPLLPTSVVCGLHLVWLLLLAASALGLYPRASIPAAALLGLGLLEQAQSQGAELSGMALMLPFLLLFAVAAYSQEKTQSHYLQGLQLLAVLLLFAAGLAKIGQGLSWITGDTFQNYLLYFRYQRPPNWWTQLFDLLSLEQSRGVCRFLALLLLGCELCAPLILWDRGLRPLLLVWAVPALIFYAGADPGLLKVFALLALFTDRHPPQTETAGLFLRSGEAAAMALAAVALLTMTARLPLYRFLAPFESATVQEAHLWAQAEVQQYFSFKRDIPIDVSQALSPLDELSLLRLVRRYQARGRSPEQLLEPLRERCREETEGRLEQFHKAARSVRLAHFEIREVKWELSEWLAFRKSGKELYLETVFRPEVEQVLARVPARRPPE